MEIFLDADAWRDVDATTEALVDAWLVREGEQVRKGQAVANVILVKANQEITAPADGRIEKILLPVGATFARNVPIGVLKEST